MAWLEPARNRDHPGHLPPTWVPVGRAGWLVHVSAIVAGIAIATVILMARSADGSDDVDAATLAAESSPPPWFGGRVEMPEHGFAVTLPDGWLAVDLTADLDLQAQRIDEIVGGASGEWLMLGEMLQGYRDQGIQLWTMMPFTIEGCGVATYQGPARSLDALAGGIYLSMSGRNDVSAVERPVSIDLPAGPARRLATLVTSDDHHGDPEPLVYYLIEADDATHLVSCTGKRRPADDWLVIAEAFELLPVEE